MLSQQISWHNNIPSFLLATPDAKSWLIRKDPDTRKVWGQEEKGVTENAIVGRHLWRSGHEFEQIPVDGEGQGSLVCWVRHDFNNQTATVPLKVFSWGKYALLLSSYESFLWSPVMWCVCVCVCVCVLTHVHVCFYLLIGKPSKTF